MTAQGLMVGRRGGRAVILGLAGLGLMAGLLGCRAVSEIYIEVGNDSDTNGSGSDSDVEQSSDEETGTETSDETQGSETSTTMPSSTETATTSSSSGESTETSSDASSSTSTTSETDTSTEDACDTPPAITPCDSEDGVFRAIELDCPSDVEGISDITLDVTNGLINTKVVTRRFGNNYWLPMGSTAMTLLSTGTLPVVDEDRWVTLVDGTVDAQSGDNGNPDVTQFPEPVAIANGSNEGKGGTPFEACDGIGDCSDTLSRVLVPGQVLSDAQWLSFSIDVPSGVQTFALDLAFFSAEFARRLGIGETFNDLALVWMSGKLYTGNLAVYDGNPLSPRYMLDFLSDRGWFGNDDHLGGTGMYGFSAESCEIPGATYPQCPRGIATPWMTLRGPVVPGETVKIVIAIADQGIDPMDESMPDNAFDSLLLLDRWRWECERCSWSRNCGLLPSDDRP
jgi:hypothetical protein